MATEIVDSSNLYEHVTTGSAPLPKEVAEDNAAQAAKKDPAKLALAEAEKAAAAAVAPPDPNAPDPDEVEGEDGLTPKQKREFTKSMLATIAKKHRAQKEAEELAASEYSRGRLAEERAAKLERELQSIRSAAKPEPMEASPPKRETFETDVAYQEALIDYRVDQKLKAAQAEAAKVQAERQRQEVAAAAAARVDAARELVADYDDVVGSVDLPVPPYIATYMQRSPMFAELGYHFAKHPDVLESLTAMPPEDALVALGEIKSTLQPFAKAKVNGVEPSKSNGVQPSTETGSAPSKPRAAPIIRPLSSGTGAQVEKDPSEQSAEEALAAWQKRHGVKLTARKRH